MNLYPTSKRNFCFNSCSFFTPFLVEQIILKLPASGFRRNQALEKNRGYTWSLQPPAIAGDFGLAETLPIRSEGSVNRPIPQGKVETKTDGTKKNGTKRLKLKREGMVLTL